MNTTQAADLFSVENTLKEDADTSDQPRTIGEAVARLRKLSLNQRDLGSRFEGLVERTLPTLKEYEISQVWRFDQWPERERLMKRSARDFGIDLVGQRTDGGYVAIQCKCYDESKKLQLADLKGFFDDAAATKEFNFDLLLLVTTCGIGANLQEILCSKGGRWVPYHIRHRDEPLGETLRKSREPRPQQAEAVEQCVKGFGFHDRGRLVMACGTGKTFTALKVAEHSGVASKRTLFISPSIALVGQARREWLRYAKGTLRSLIVCSDSTTGKAMRGSTDGIDLLELECPVTTHASQIAKFLSGSPDGHSVVFCTYQSLDKVADAQSDYGAPDFNLAIVDEAHRTSGIQRSADETNVGFTAIHNGDYVRSAKRLYMTATPRVYTTQSKKALETRGITLIDMTNSEIFGPEFYRLKFKDAVQPADPKQEPFLTDYRVIVLGIRDRPVSRQLTQRLREKDDGTVERLGIADAILKTKGTLLALNGQIESEYQTDLPRNLRASIGFCNRVKVSRWFAHAFQDSKLKEQTSKRLADRMALDIHAEHLDGSCTAFERATALERLSSASEQEGECRIVMNVKLFSEGVDVPTLDAVVFMEPRKSQVDVVQAVGRVMRRARGKELGYIVLPVVVSPNASNDPADIFKDAEGYQTVGRVLAALQSHDERLAETPYRFLKYVDVETGRNGGGDDEDGEGERIQISIFDDAQTKNLFTHLMKQIGLGDKGARNANEIIYSVEQAAKYFDEAGAAQGIGGALDIPFDGSDKNRKHICTTGSLLIQNACLLQQRLKGLPRLSHLRGTNGLGSESDMRGSLRDDWESILARDYKPIFNPALRVLNALPEDRGAVNTGLTCVVECANSLATQLDELGYDHAGPLYHKILGSAESDGAYYTKNPAALLLAKLAISSDLRDWSHPDALTDFRIIDPACGTGTLLMAAAKTIKERIRAVSQEHGDAKLHKMLVEDCVFGLDINEHALQLAASNLTLGAPDVDYQRMNLYPMEHGVRKNGEARAGSLELLAGDRPFIEHGEHSNVASAGGRQIDGAVSGGAGTEIVGRCDLVIMNPPFTNNVNRNTRFGGELKKRMREREQFIEKEVEIRQGQSAASLIDSNSVSTFFTPLADKLLRADRGTIAKVLPATACASASGLKERQYFARRFHIERLVTCHAKKDFSFSGNTDIHECLMVGRRWPEGKPKPKPSTQVVVLKKMPENVRDVEGVVTAIENGVLGDLGNSHEISSQRMEAGDWSAVQWFSSELIEAANDLLRQDRLIPIGRTKKVGPAGQRIRDAFKKIDSEVPGALKAHYSKSAQLRNTVRADPEQWALPKLGKESMAASYIEQASHFLVATGLDTNSGILTGLYSGLQSVGSGWVPVEVCSKAEAKGLSIWWNSTPVWLMLLNMRSRKLTWPEWSLAQLETVLVPDPQYCDYAVLEDTFNSVAERELKPMRYQAEDFARQEIDKAAAKVIGLDESLVAEWRALLAAEPTVSGA